MHTLKMYWQWILCLFLNSVYTSVQLSNIHSTTYVAAVVEFAQRNIKNSSEAILQSNSDRYANFIKQASSKHVDIIVFPEDGLTSTHLPERKNMDAWTTVIPAVSDNSVPCTEYKIPVSDALRKLSCAARDYKMYVIINIAEKVPCMETNCPTDKVFYYNSNVVFDRTGKVIARYRKTHLFKEPQFNKLTEPEIVTFDTDFGITFGTLICFDILFEEPGLTMIRKENISDIVFTTAWFSEVPFLTAIQMQAGWAHAEDINLLASGYNDPIRGNSGSGIYFGRNGIGKAIMPFNKHDEMLIVEVPKRMKPTVPQTLHHTRASNDLSTPEYKTHIYNQFKKMQDASPKELLLLHDDLSAYTTVPFNNSVSRSVCHNNFCCDFKIEMTNVDQTMLYRIVVFSGVRTYAHIINAGTTVCAVIQCSNDSITSCGSIQSSKTEFRILEVTANFDDYADNLVMPTTLSSILLPLHGWSYTTHQEDDHVHVNMMLERTQKNIVTFGIYCRNFTRDNTDNIATVKVVYWASIAMSALFSILCGKMLVTYL